MQKQVTEPSIRFAGFSDAWERRKLGELAEFSKGAGYSKSDIQSEGTPLILYGRLYTKYQTIISEIDTYAAPKSGSVYSKGGEVIVPASGETAEDISIASVVAKSGVLIGGDLNILCPCQALKPDFLAYLISYGEPHLKLSQYAQGKSVVHIHNSDIKAVDILFPKRREQDSICKLLVDLDRLITLHQQKYEKLVNLKKAMLDKMFPKNGELVPAVRFAGFSSNWKRRKLGDISSLITKGTTPRDKSNTGNVNFVKIENIDNESGEITITHRISQHEHETYLRRSQLRDNDVLFSIAGTLGCVTSVNTTILPANTNQALAIVRLKAGHLDYIKTFLKGKAVSDFIRKNPTIGAQPNLSLEQVANLEICSPNEHEQVIIGIFFKRLDYLITLHKRKQERLHNIKKAFLEKMFV